MALRFADFVSILKSNLSTTEKDAGIVYAVTERQGAGKIDLPGVQIVLPWDGYIAFIDGQPLANWGHPARYLLVNRENGALVSVPARLPPFKAKPELAWQLVHKGATVPDAAVAKL